MGKGESMEYSVKLDNFEGPMDLLFHLIKVNKIDIYNIPINTITKQYLEYIPSVNDENIDKVSEFLVMASTLLEIKSKMLLPSKNLDDFSDIYDVNDPRNELVEKLVEYIKFKEASSYLKNRETLYGKVFFKEQDDIKKYAKEVDIEKLNSELDKELLISAMKKMLLNLPNYDENRKNFFKKLKKDRYTVDEKIEYIKERINKEKKILFHKLFKNKITKEEIIVTFLALLELLKLNKIKVKQDNIFDDILISVA